MAELSDVNERLTTVKHSVARASNDRLTSVEQPLTSVKHPLDIVNERLTGDRLTTGEAFRELQRLGLRQTIGTFRRWLADALIAGQLPPELQRLGLTADFEFRSRANPKDNSVRWLGFSTELEGEV